MRRSNENTILALLRQEPGLPGSTIAKRTGLAPQTVSVLLRNLENERLIVRGPSLRGKRGQPAVPFRLRGEAGFVIGMEISWQHSDFVLLDLAGNVTPGPRFTYQYPNPDTLVSDTLAAVEGLRAEIARRGGKLTGIARTGPAGLGERAWFLGASEDECRRLTDIHLNRAITDATGHEVTVSNDGAAAAWAETIFGRAPADQNFAHVYLSTFIGSALSVGGRVLGDTGDSAAKIGAAMTRDPEGVAHPLHTSASLWALAQHLANKGHRTPSQGLADWDWDEIEPDFVAWLSRIATDYALVFANTSAIVGVPTIVLDGILPRTILARFVNAIQARINTLPIDVFDRPIVLLGQSGPSAPALGAAHQLFHARYFTT